MLSVSYVLVPPADLTLPTSGIRAFASLLLIFAV
jgi:hypothetical protein